MKNDIFDFEFAKINIYMKIVWVLNSMTCYKEAASIEVKLQNGRTFDCIFRVPWFVYLKSGVIINFHFKIFEWQ